ncbi:LuxR C-terminal-related transcriptional regulator [Streptomyces sp. NPDC050147]|uniref:LuxR C-terminal-related transcriptional regulator n=1 Tax=Streptomyces sp. NPDC050147 TaxID=3155513 RepID=UPI003445E9C9
MTRRLIRRFREDDDGPSAGRQRRRAEARSRLEALMEKEREVLIPLSGGLSDTGVAAALHVSEATAKTHLSWVQSKLSLTNWAQAATLAHHAGLVK